MSFPFDLHSAAVSDSQLPCRAHAIPDHALLLKVTAQHGRREPSCGVTVSVWLLPAITRSSTKLLSDAYQSQMQVASLKTKHRLSWTRKRVVAAHYIKGDVTQFGYFRLPCGHSRRTGHCRNRAGARHGNGMGTAWTRHGHSMGTAWAQNGHGMLCVNRP